MLAPIPGIITPQPQIPLGGKKLFHGTLCRGAVFCHAKSSPFPYAVSAATDCGKRPRLSADRVSRSVLGQVTDSQQVYGSLSVARISSSCDKQVISQSINPASNKGQSTIVHEVHCPLVICHFDAMTSAGSFLWGQMTVCVRLTLDAASFSRADVSLIAHPLGIS